MELERVVIAHEGDDTDQWYILEPGSVRWKEDESIVITENYGKDLKSQLGYAKNISREENGDITAEVPTELVLRWKAEDLSGTKDLLGKPMVIFGTYVTEVKMDIDATDKKRVSDCLLVMIGRQWNVAGANPGANLT